VWLKFCSMKITADVSTQQLNDPTGAARRLLKREIGMADEREIRGSRQRALRH
jgi:hypothetical protein